MIERDDLVRRMSAHIEGRMVHTADQLMVFADAILDRRPDGVLVEAGCWRGASTARLSHLAAALDTQLVACDSFRGLPANVEPHERNIYGGRVRGQFRTGALAATIAQAQATVERYGVPEVVQWRPGWFTETLPTLTQPVAGAYLDVDLAASARTCLTHLWPLLTDRGLIVSQDGHLPLVVAEIQAWIQTAAPQPADVVGLGSQQMVTVLR